MGESCWISFRAEELECFLGSLASLGETCIVYDSPNSTFILPANEVQVALQFVLSRQENLEEFASTCLSGTRFRVATCEEVVEEKRKRHSLLVGKILFELNQDPEKRVFKER